MSVDYVISVRNVVNGTWGSEPGIVRWLRVPAAETAPRPEHAITSDSDRRKYIDEVIEASGGPGMDASIGQPDGDLLVYVHGYNNSVTDVLTRHRLVKRRLREFGYEGEVLSFDWPSGESTLAYLEDRSDAKDTAFLLVEECIKPFAAMQTGGAVDESWSDVELTGNETPAELIALREGQVEAARRNARNARPCYTNVHVLGHSTGAYVIREAFDDADDRRSLSSRNWSISQVAFFAADISKSSFNLGDSATTSLIRHSARITNYYNLYDAVLSISNAKRLLTSSRLGRVGLPDECDGKCVDVDCSDHYCTLNEPGSLAGKTTYGHSWYFDEDDAVTAPLYEDLALTIRGGVDRNVIRTRKQKDDGGLKLVRVP